MKKRIYLDHNAATPVDPRVVAGVADLLKAGYGNPSSVHAEGRDIKKRLLAARDTIAESLEVRSDEIVFTSGATEGANLVIRGLLQHNPKGHIVTTNIEHSCVRNTVKEMAEFGCEVTHLTTGTWGAVSAEAVEQALRNDTKLIAIMAANNETGVKNPIAEIAEIAARAGIPLFVDGAAFLGKEELHIFPGISAMSISGQKIHALQGSGFCFIRKSLKLFPLMTGGSQEYGRRAGTENVPGIVSLGIAVSILKEEQQKNTRHMQMLRDRFEEQLKVALPDLAVNGEGPRLVNTSNLYFPDINGETLLMALDMAGIAASHGSACTSGALEPSHVLLGMGYPRSRVNGSLRFSVSRLTTKEEIDTACAMIVDAVRDIQRKDAKTQRKER